MPAIASIEDLKAAKADIVEVIGKFPEGVSAVLAVLDTHKMVGYKNLIKMFKGATPEEIKV